MYPLSNATENFRKALDIANRTAAMADTSFVGSDDPELLHAREVFHQLHEGFKAERADENTRDKVACNGRELEDLADAGHKKSCEGADRN